MRATFNISTESWKLVDIIDRSPFFCLDEKSVSRANLVSFAIALGYKQGYKSDLQGRKSIVRTEYMQDLLYSFAALFYEKSISTGEKEIESITNDNELLDLAEQYAETGFSVLRDKMNTLDEESFCLDLISQMDKWSEQYFTTNYENE